MRVEPGRACHLATVGVTEDDLARLGEAGAVEGARRAHRHGARRRRHRQEEDRGARLTGTPQPGAHHQRFAACGRGRHYREQKRQPDRNEVRASAATNRGFAALGFHVGRHQRQACSAVASRS
jgi:hypothetical protein